MTAPTEASGEWQWMPKNPPLDMMKAVFLMPLLSEKQVRAMYAELLAAAPKPPAAALDPRMPDEWRVEVSTHGQQVVAIGNDYVSSREIQDDNDLIMGCAQHLLSFVGYGLPPTFHPPAAADEGRDGDWKALGKAIEQVARELPIGYLIELNVENGAAWVRLANSDGDTQDIDVADSTLAEQIAEALRIAKEPPDAAQSGAGGGV